MYVTDFFSALAFFSAILTNGARGVLNKVCYGEAPPLTLLYTVLEEKVPILYTFFEKRHPFHMPTLEHCIPFLSSCNEVNEQYY